MTGPEKALSFRASEHQAWERVVSVCHTGSGGLPRAQTPEALEAIRQAVGEGTPLSPSGWHLGDSDGTWEIPMQAVLYSAVKP